MTAKRLPQKNVSNLILLLSLGVALFLFLLFILNKPKENTQTTPAVSTEPIDNDEQEKIGEPIQNTIPNDQQYDMPILSLRFIPLINEEKIDIQETGDLFTDDPNILINRINLITDESLKALSEGSRFHGYKNEQSPPALKYQLFKSKTYYQSLSPGLPITWNGAYRPNYKSILEQEDVCNYVDKLGVKEVWVWGYHTSKIEPVESNMSMGTNIKNYWNYPDYGDISNSENSNDLLTCKNTYVLYNLNYGRMVGEVLENHAHHIEAVQRFLRPVLWNMFVGECGEDKKVYHCGWTHYPPNVMQYCSDHDYDWYNQQRVPSDCGDWKPDGSGDTTMVNCTTWNPGCKDDGGVGFKVWWMQNIPGLNNNLVYERKQIGNWWQGIGNFDQAIKIMQN